jgi:hypothetical protein
MEELHAVSAPPAAIANIVTLAAPVASVLVPLPNSASGQHNHRPANTPIAHSAVQLPKRAPVAPVPPGQMAIAGSMVDSAILEVIINVSLASVAITGFN